MPMYALRVFPLMQSVTTTGAIQAWFTNDSAAVGKLQRVCEWWGGLTNRGPSYGYHVNPLKSVLLVKLAFHHQATELFGDTGVRICTDGVQYLGDVIGTPEFIQSFLEQKVLCWREEVECLCNITKSQPQAAHRLHSWPKEQVVILMPCHANQKMTGYNYFHTVVIKGVNGN